MTSNLMGKKQISIKHDNICISKLPNLPLLVEKKKLTQSKRAHLCYNTNQVYIHAKDINMHFYSLGVMKNIP